MAHLLKYKGTISKGVLEDFFFYDLGKTLITSMKRFFF